MRPFSTPLLIYTEHNLPVVGRWLNTPLKCHSLVSSSCHTGLGIYTDGWFGTVTTSAAITEEKQFWRPHQTACVKAALDALSCNKYFCLRHLQSPEISALTFKISFTQTRWEIKPVTPFRALTHRLATNSFRNKKHPHGKHWLFIWTI